MDKDIDQSSSEQSKEIRYKFHQLNDPDYPYKKQQQYWSRYALQCKPAIAASKFSPVDLRTKKSFELYWYQLKIFYALIQYKRICVVASRQIGKSETLLRFAFVIALLAARTEIVICSSGKRHAAYILRRIKAIIDQSPYKIPLRIDSTTELEFFNGSHIFCLPNSYKAIPGFSPHYLLIDEVDSIHNWQAFWEAASPLVSKTNGVVVASGTYWGKRQLWNLQQGGRGSQTANKDLDWTALQFPVTVNPPENIEQQIHDMHPAAVDQQFFCKPMDIIGTLFPYEFLESCYELDRSGKPVFSTFAYPPDRDCLYFGSWDPAKQRDGSVFIIMEHRSSDLPLRIVRTFDWHGMDYVAQYHEIRKLDEIYRFYKIVYDRTGLGVPIGDGLKEVLNPGSYNREPVLVKGRVKREPSLSKIWGLDLNQKNKLTMATDASLAVANREVSFGEMLLEFNGYPKIFNELHDLDPIKLDHPPGGSSDYAWAFIMVWNLYEKVSRQLLNVKNKYGKAIPKIAPERKMDLPQGAKNLAAINI